MENLDLTVSAKIPIRVKVLSVITFDGNYPQFIEVDLGGGPVIAEVLSQEGDIVKLKVDDLEFSIPK